MAQKTLWKRTRRGCKKIVVYDIENQTYRFTGGSVINSPRSKQEGILIHLRRVTDNKPLELFIDKRDMAHLAKLTRAGRRFWKRFRLPKMIEQKCKESDDT